MQFSYFQSIVLGAVQGLTEFLPISSSGHLIILPNLLGWESQPLVFDTFLHLGTAFALILYFWDDLAKILKDFYIDIMRTNGTLSLFTSDGKVLTYIILGCFPAAVFGLLLEDIIESTFRSTFWVGLFLLIGSILMFFADLKAKKLQKSETNLLSSSDKLNYTESLIIGFYQTLALFPGVSRSGSTISGGILAANLNREQAARFSFLLSIPIVIAAATFKMIDSYKFLYTADPMYLYVGFLSSFFVGLITIKFLLGFLKKFSLNIFIFYRVLLALFLIFAF